MEKFGIFELLDTLSALVGDKDEPAPPQTPPKESVAPSVQDAVFSPPSYAAGKGNENGEQALSSFLTRHDEMVKRIGKNK